MAYFRDDIRYHGVWPWIWHRKSNIVKDHTCVSCSGRLVIFWDHFGKRTDVISGQYPVPRPLPLILTWKVKFQVRGHDRVSCSWKLAIVWDYFGTPAEVISGRYPVCRPLTLKSTWKVKLQVQGHGRVSCSGRLAIVWDYFGTPAEVILGRYRYPVLRPCIGSWKSGQRSWSCKLLRVADYRLRPFW